MGNLFGFFRTAAIFIIAFLFIFSCAPEDEDYVERDGRLVNTVANEAWIDTEVSGERGGFIFRADGSYSLIVDYMSPLFPWLIIWEGTWATSGNRLTLSGLDTYSYTVTGNSRLTIEGAWVLNKASNVTPARMGHDSRLINTATNQAWIDSYSPGNRDGFILRADGEYIAVSDHGTWSNNGYGEWFTIENLLFLDGPGYYGGSVGIFSLMNSNNTMIADWITENGDIVREEFTRTPNINIGSTAGQMPQQQMRSDKDFSKSLSEVFFQEADLRKIRAVRQSEIREIRERVSSRLSEKIK